MAEKMNVHGVIIHTDSVRKDDFLYRVSLKGFIQNEAGEVLVVKETGRENGWDLPGGGMDHGEDIKVALARELFEEVSLKGDFDYQILDVDEPRFAKSHSWWQLRLVYRIRPESMKFMPGEDGDEVAFIDPKIFKDSEHYAERQVYHYAQLIQENENAKVEL